MTADCKQQPPFLPDNSWKRNTCVKHWAVFPGIGLELLQLVEGIYTFDMTILVLYLIYSRIFNASLRSSKISAVC